MRNNTIPTEQRIINFINAKTDFAYPFDAMIPNNVDPVRLHRSYNPSMNYDLMYKHVYNAVTDEGSVLVGVHHAGGDYEVLLYKSEF